MELTPTSLPKIETMWNTNSMENRPPDPPSRDKSHTQCPYYALANASAALRSERFDAMAAQFEQRLT